ncbi:hypothetical protein [Methylobacterium segetis]|uniref:hypothetical protein n=1 Tax=Methylobacterium segetis TaxID=2488750 RepID=UPI00104FD5C0|nr:hypothetical protein [Methylobacterium segetis]
MTGEALPRLAGPALNAGNRNSGYRLCLAIILAITLLQKIALPGTANALSVTTALVPSLVLLCWLCGRLRLDSQAFVLFAIFVLAAAASFVLNAGAEKVSPASLALVCAVQSILIFRPVTQGGCRSGLSLFRDVMALFSVVGIAQFVLQRIVGTKLAFCVDFYFPAGMLLDKYNNIVPIYYGSEILRSNGVFFAEPAFFSQFVGLATICELLTLRRPVRLGIYAAALLCSYSGTGLITLALFGCVWTVARGQFVYVLGALGAIGVVLLFGTALEIDALTSRMGEFTTPNSSGHARFVSAFTLLDRVTFSDLAATLIGKGPGTITTYYERMPFLMFDPTWAKLLFEYGLVGFISYFGFLYVTLKQANRSFLLPLLVTYLFLGGYLTDVAVISLILVLGIYNQDNRSIRFPGLEMPILSVESRRPKPA